MAKGHYPGFEPGVLAWAVGWDLLLGDIPQGVDPNALAARAADALEGGAPQNSRLARSVYGNAAVVALPYLAWAGTKVLLAAMGRVHVALYREMATVLLKGTTSIRAAADSLREAEETVAQSRVPGSGEGVAAENGMRSSDEAEAREARVVSRALRTLAGDLRDNIVGPLFYFSLFGVPGAVAYRVVHVVADRWGSRVDDPLSTKTRWLQTAAAFVPSLLSGLLVAGAAQATEQRGSPAWEMSRQQAREGERLDGGWAEGALAGALGVRIEGEGESDSSASEGRAPTVNDLPRARRLFWGATAGAVGASLLVAALRHATTLRR